MIQAIYIFFFFYNSYVATGHCTDRITCNVQASASLSHLAIAMPLGSHELALAETWYWTKQGVHVRRALLGVIQDFHLVVPNDAIPLRLNPRTLPKCDLNTITTDKGGLVY